MSAAAPTDVTAAPTDAPATSTSPTGASLWRAARGPAAVALVLVLLSLVLAYTASTREQGALDPRSVSPQGSRALATLLRDQGVSVDLVRTTAEARAQAGPGTTLLVAVPDLLDAEARRALAGVDASVVLVEPGAPAVRTFLPTVRPTGAGPVDTRAPACSLPAARAAGPAVTGGRLFSGGGNDVDRCYAVGGNASLVHGRSGGNDVTLLGSAAPLTNDRLADEGNAALAMRLLGERSRLVWYLQDPADVLGGGSRSLGELMPDWVGAAAAQLGVAVVVLALWRARRLGPVVSEPLPVVVRASESVEGRARLYVRARARGRAAEAVRAASRDRLVPLVGLPRGAGPDSIVDAVAARTGRRVPDVGALLYGPAPGDDDALVSLADALDTLEGEVHSP